MWKDQDNNTVDGQYTAPNGTTYPAAFPREEIPGLTEHPDPVVPPHVPTMAEINAPIYAQLDELDRKSIRALREGDAARVAQIEAQATALRATLVK